MQGKKTQFFLPESPDVIFEMLQDYCTINEEEEIKVELDETQYKAMVISDKYRVELGVKITKVGDQDNFCVDFTRKSG